jgi:hypothetical protein
MLAMIKFLYVAMVQFFFLIKCFFFSPADAGKLGDAGHD